MRNKKIRPGDFVRCLKSEDLDAKGFVVSTSRVSKRLPPMATVLWSDGTMTTKWQDDLTLVSDQEYLIQ